MYCIVDMYVCARGLVRWISVHWILSPFQNSFVQCSVWGCWINSCIYCTVLYSMAEYIVLCIMTIIVYRRLGPLGTLGTLQTLISPVPWLPQKGIHWYLYYYVDVSFAVDISTTSIPTPEKLQTSNK